MCCGQRTLGAAFDWSAALNLIGAGRREADALAPVTLQIENWMAGVAAQLPTAPLTTLQGWVDDGRRIAAEFRAFAGNSAFTDGRASRQALASIMPRLDGTDPFGLHVDPEGGLIGRLERRILELGGAIPRARAFVQGAGGQIIDPGADYGGGASTAGVPQAGWIPPALYDFWEQVTGHVAPRAAPTAGPSIGSVLLVMGALVLISRPGKK